MDKALLRWNFVFQYGYVLTNIINSFVLLPFYVYYINDVQLGLWWATGNVLAWLTLSDPGIGDVLQQKLAELTGLGNNEEISKTIGSGLIATIFMFFLSIIIGLVFFFFLDNFLNFDLDNYSNLKWAFLISVIATGVTLVTFALAGINQGLLRSKHVAISYVTSNIVFFVVNLILLFMGFQLMSIAIAAVVRALYLAGYNLIIILSSSKKSIGIIFDKSHFKKFLKVFSYTSASKVITSFSNSIDLIILARYIPPQMITLFEINRRPIKMLQSLLGRYSVALMPGISFGVGKDREGVKNTISRQFRFFLIMTFAFTALSILCYESLISLWIDASKYAGDSIMFLLVATFFFALIGYFMSNMTYATGDIKANSLVNGIKGIILLVSIPTFASLNGLSGVLWTTLVTTIVVDFGYFALRLRKLGYFEITIGHIRLWATYLIISVAAFITTVFSVKMIGSESTLLLSFLNASGFIILFLFGLLIVDEQFRSKALKYIKR